MKKTDDIIYCLTWESQNIIASHDRSKVMEIVKLFRSRDSKQRILSNKFEDLYDKYNSKNLINRLGINSILYDIRNECQTNISLDVKYKKIQKYSYYNFVKIKVT